MSKCTKIAMLTAAVCLGHAGLASADFNTSYTIDLSGGITGGRNITNIMLAEESAFQGSLTWAFGADGMGVTTIENPFPTMHPTERSLLLGIVQDLPGDAPGQKHMVLMMDPLAATLSEHIAWGTLFRNTLEDQLIADIELATSGQDFSIIQPGLDGIGRFTGGNARDGILDPIGNTVSAYFTTGGAFTVVSWSDGTILGTGTSTVIAIPEPANVGLMGVAMLAMARRRRV